MKKLSVLILTVVCCIWFNPEIGLAFSKNAPDLLITEVSPQGKTYEYIEIYNNTDVPIDLRDYNIRYLSMNKSMQVWDIKESTIIEPKSTKIIWIKNAGSKEKLDHQDFKRHYRASVDQTQLIRLEGDLRNSSKNTVVLATDTGAVVSYVSYDKGLTHFKQDKGAKKLKQNKQLNKNTPGQVSDGQIPLNANIQTDHTKPIVRPITMPDDVPERTDVSIEIQIEDEHLIKRAEIFYKRSQDAEFTQANMLMKTTTSYQAIISRYDVYGSVPTFEYYMEISDGQHVIRYPEKGTKTIKIGNPDMYKPLKPGLSVQDNTILKGTKKIQVQKESAEEKIKLMVDGQKLKTQRILSRPAAIVFEGLGIDERKKSAVYMGDRLISKLKPTSGLYLPYELSIPIDELKPGKNTISIHTGTKKETFMPGSTVEEKDIDHFSIKNIKLLMGDGTMIRPISVNSITGDGDENREGTHGAQEWKVGNQGVLVLSYEFIIPAAMFTAEEAEIDTMAYQDGVHHIQSTGSAIHQADVVFDNTAPKLHVKAPLNGRTYKGTFTIDADPEDEVTSIASIKGYLDGREITLPYTTSSGKLSKGKHKVVFMSVDAAGNRKKETIHFNIVDEAPIITNQATPLDNAKVSVHPKLSVKVDDPTNDQIVAKFFSGNRYDFTSKGRNHLKAFSNIADEEPPPNQTYPREKDISSNRIKQIASVDKKYWVTASNKGFPYQRFEISLDEAPAEMKEAEVKWVGHSLQGRKVTLYAWNVHKLRWDALAYGYGKKDFSLKAKVETETYMENQKLQVLVQDQIIGDVNRPFNLIWMSDTQYYSESFPHIFPVMTNWIRIQNQLGNAEYVIHTGDIVNVRWDTEQWNIADKSMGILDEHHVPYGVVSGNHDVGNMVLDYRNYAKYFGEKRFKNTSHYGGGMKNNTNHYDLVSFGGHDFLFLYLGWGKETTTETLKWVDKVLSQYSERNVVLAVHNYLDHKGKRTHNGNQVFRNIVWKYENIKLVLAGHIAGASRNVETIPLKDNPKKFRKVYEMLADYQSGPEGGEGYMRMLRFNPEAKQLSVKTYSPYLDDYNYFEPEVDEFTIDQMELNPIQKQVATDYIGVNVYSNNLLGEDKDGRNQEKVQVRLKDLKNKQDYFWYVEVNDSYGGWTRSPIWKFTTK